MRHLALTALACLCTTFGCGSTDSVAVRPAVTVVQLPALVNVEQFQLVSDTAEHNYLRMIGDVTGDGLDNLLTSAVRRDIHPPSSALVLSIGGLDQLDVVTVVPSPPQGDFYTWTARAFAAVDVNGDGIGDLVVVYDNTFDREVVAFFGPLSGAYRQDDADWRLVGYGRAPKPYIHELPFDGGTGSALYVSMVDSSYALATDSAVVWPLPVQRGTYQIADIKASGGAMLPKERWTHESLNRALLRVGYSYYMTLIPGRRCRLDDNQAFDFVTGTMYKLAAVWDWDDLVRPGATDIGPNEDIVVATESGAGLEGFTPSDLECFDFDGDGFDEVFIGTRSSINAADGNPGTVFMLDAPFANLFTAWERRTTVTEGPFAGRELTSLGDIDGDGLGDLCMSVSGDGFGGFEPQPSEVRLSLSSTGIAPATRILGQPGDYLTCVDGTGDVDGDGLTDFLIYASGRESLWLVTGKTLRSLAE